MGGVYSGALCLLVHYYGRPAFLSASHPSAGLTLCEEVLTLEGASPLGTPTILGRVS
jgi:hypothetical protein